MGFNDDYQGMSIYSVIVTVSDFYIGKYEVTVAEFKKFIDASNYKTDAEKNGYSYIYDGSWVKKKWSNLER